MVLFVLLDNTIKEDHHQDTMRDPSGICSEDQIVEFILTNNLYYLRYFGHHNNCL